MTTSVNTFTPDTSKLTKKELMYWMMIRTHGAVPYLIGRPGDAKTAILRSIADKLGLQLIDLRLSQIDEVVVTGLPTEDKNGESFSFKVPAWALKANSAPTLIVFEEVNRARLEQRNAAMQIWAEREVGMNLKLNKTVFMAATGNLGDEDGSDVEMLESAQKGRLATIRHSLTIKDWEDGFAKENVHPLVLSFVNAQPQYFYKYEGDEADAYASPRSWTYLSNFIKTNFGDKNVNYSSLKDAMLMVGKAYVGSSINPFIRYIEQLEQFTIQDILKDYDAVRPMVKKFTRPQISEFLTNLAEINVEKLKDSEVDNIIKFTKDIKNDDELMNYFIKLVHAMQISSMEKDKNSIKNTARIINAHQGIKERLVKINTGN